MLTNNSALSTQHSALVEIRRLRRLIRQTHRRINSGDLNFITGTTQIAKLTNSLSNLLLTQHRTSPTPDQLYNERLAELHRIINAILTEQDLGPPPPPTPSLKTKGGAPSTPTNN